MSDLEFFDTSQKNSKIPNNREVDIINKWKDVDKADDDLEKIREAHLRKLKQYENRWRDLEKGQKQIKQNLVKFNNFIKEKMLKIEEGSVKFKEHHQVYKMKQEQLISLSKQLKTLKIAKSELSQAVGKLEVYKIFLDSVVSQECHQTCFVMMPQFYLSKKNTLNIWLEVSHRKQI